MSSPKNTVSPLPQPIQNNNTLDLLALPSEITAQIVLFLFQKPRTKWAWERQHRHIKSRLADIWRLAASCKRLRAIVFETLDRMAMETCTDEAIRYARNIVMRDTSMIFARVMPDRFQQQALPAPIVHPYMDKAFAAETVRHITLENVDLRALGRVIYIGTPDQAVTIKACLFAHSDITIVSDGGIFHMTDARKLPALHSQPFGVSDDSVHFTFAGASRISQHREHVNTPVTVAYLNHAMTYVSRMNWALGISETAIVSYSDGHRAPAQFAALVAGSPYTTSRESTRITIVYPGLYDIHGATEVVINHNGCELTIDEPQPYDPLTPRGFDMTPDADDSVEWATVAVSNRDIYVKSLFIDVASSRTTLYKSVMRSLRRHMTHSFAQLTMEFKTTPRAPLPVFRGIKNIISLYRVLCTHVPISEHVVRDAYQNCVAFRRATTGTTRIVFRFVPPVVEVVRAIQAHCGENSVSLEYHRSLTQITPQFRDQMLRAFAHQGMDLY
jgi:hypothetical protein